MKIELQNLTKVYGTGLSSVLALSELELVLQEKEICIVRGPNGSGKSTLISILAGEISQTVGAIKVSNRIEQAPRISVINQFDNLIDELTVREHFEKFNRLENLSLINEEIVDKFPKQLSRGQAQIVAVALALGTDTDLLLADEPTGALGHQDSALVYEFIRTTAHNNSSAVILVTHDRQAEQIADRVVRLRDGRISETWQPNSGEYQVINSRGWVRIPDEASDGLNPAVRISPNETGAEIVGRSHRLVHVTKSGVTRLPADEIKVTGKDISTFYGEVEVSHELNFQIRANELLCVFGNSGSGKSTLLRTICGLHKEFTGELTSDPKYRIPYFNIEQMYGLELNLHELKVDPELLDKLELTSISSRPLKTYSGGQLQRSLVAIALSNSAELIVLDEPTSALDDSMADLVIDTLLESPKTLIVASHDERLKDRATQIVEL